MVLKEKILNTTNIPVTIPSRGETYELNEEVSLTKKEVNDHRFLRLEVLERMKTLREELDDMETIVKEDYLNNTTSDEEVNRLKERLKDIERQIVKIVENK